MISVGQVVRLLPPLKAGLAEFIAVIPSGQVPDPKSVQLWYKDNIPKSAYRALKSDRYVFSRCEDIDGFVIIPSKILTKLISLT